ncbi:aminopeptidase N-like [Panonychus citri]|uniref:aminopeptidase N-like n=1 Tax=Panonychus citri TaxID=50023 RepID=UPI0023073CA7|nr:aminopeptidase N-like [Panonychus citri]
MMNESSREKLDMDLGEFCVNNRGHHNLTNKMKNQSSDQPQHQQQQQQQQSLTSNTLGSSHGGYNESTLIFDQTKGIFLPRWTIILIASLIVSGLVIFTLLLFHLLPICTNQLNPIQSTLSSSSSSSQSTTSPSSSSSQSTTLISSPTTINHVNQLNQSHAARLPISIVPSSYDIKLQPFIIINNFTFNGDVKIILDVRQSTNRITLHANDLTIYNESIKVERLTFNTMETSKLTDNNKQQSTNRNNQISGGNSGDIDDGLSSFLVPKSRTIRSIVNSTKSIIPIVSTSIEKENDFFIINLSTDLIAGNSYSITMRFLGNLNKDLAGFYRSSYNDTITNQKRWIATTQFEPTDARRAFPCFDEPALKSIFNITLVHLTNMTALSNMPVVKTIERGEWTETQFAPTVNMSTYLLAFVVGNIENDTVKEGDRYFGVWGRPGTRESRKFALTIGPKILQHYEKFFGINYPLPKTDMIAVPDFNAGAMENWGIIIYRETTMLFDETSASIFTKKRVADVVAHELAHQWFGNLVTPKWWDDLWLNEGFATYMEYEGVNSVHPEWRTHDAFVIEGIQVVFELDCLTTSHPISVKVNDPDEINEIFDRISYEKGASLIRMMRYTLGDKVFREGVSSYLKALAYKNAEQDDLWHYLTIAQNQSSSKVIPVKKVMDSWALQVGFPLVTLTRTYGPKSQKSAKLTQNRFLLSLNNSIESKERWEIPISLTTQSNRSWDPLPQFWIHQDEGQKSMDVAFLPKDDEWIILNLQEVGYYKVNYDERNWKMLIDQLKRDHSQIHVLNRAQIIDDLFDLARANVVNYSLALNVTNYLIDEEDFIPWGSATGELKFLDSMLRRTNIYGRWKNYVLSLIVNKYNRYGWREPNNPNDIASQVMQSRVINWACYYQHMPCIREAQRQFESWKSAVADNMTNPIHPNLRGEVVCVAIQWGTEKDWQWVWDQFQSSSLASEKEYLMRGLGCSREPWILNRYLEMSLDDSSGIRKQDGSTVFRTIANSEYGRDIAVNYFRNKWDKIVAYYGKSYFAFGNLIRAVSSSITIQYELNQFKSFYDKVRDDLGSAQRSFKQAIEKAEANVNWMNLNYREIEDWLNQQKTN